jgi:hypothetical protein
MDDEPTFDLDAAGLRADGADLLIGIEVLARKLEEALPQATHVRRRARRLLSKDKVVEHVEVRRSTAPSRVGSFTARVSSRWSGCRPRRRP